MRLNKYRNTLLTLIIAGVMVAACGPQGTAEIATPTQSNGSVSNPVATNTPDTAAQIKHIAETCINPIDDPYAKDLATKDPDLFSWLVFLYLNCPAQNAQTSLIWETWKPNYAVYLPNGQAPSPWGSPLPTRTLSADPEISGYTLLDNAGQPGLYEIRMNESAFNYIVGRELYNLDGQLKFFNDAASAPIVFSKDAVEIKAIWLILDPKDPRAGRYYTIQSQYVDKDGKTQPVFVGLAGLHITSKILPNWVWATFEQVDNQSVTPAPKRIPTSPQTQKLNDLVHASLPADSRWQYYDLRGSQIDFTDSNNKPTLLANTLIETNFQNSSSCITCHQLASRGAASQGRLGFFNTTNAGIQGYVGNNNDPNNTYYDAFGAPVCFNQQANAFSACDNPSKIVYKLMDFVWSFREAQKQKP